MTLPNIVLIATGGTIAGQASHPEHLSAYKSGQRSAHQLLDAVPHIKQLAQVEVENFSRIDSKDATPIFWQDLGRFVQKILNRHYVCGVAITHGTDTLEETAYYLNLTLKTSKPVVLTAAMRAANALSADGPINLFHSIKLAAHAPAGGLGALVCINQQIHSAREVSKTNTMHLDSFSSPNSGPLGCITDHQVQLFQAPLKKHTVNSRFTVDTPLEKVDILYGYAGICLELVRFISQRVKGLVWAGPGNGALSADLEEFLKTCKDLSFVRSSRTGSGMVQNDSEDFDLSNRWITANTLNPQKARVLLALCLGEKLNQPDLQAYFDEY